MVSIFDNEYKATKRIKQGVAKLSPPFDELARWIAATWRVSVLNVIHDGRDSTHAPRLQVILEETADSMKFFSGVNFDPAKQQAIKDHFIKLIPRGESTRYETDGLFVVFSAFAPLAREEADAQIPKDEIEALKVQIANPELWEISRCFARVTFFFFTNAQVKRHLDAGKKALYSKMYFALLKPRDEFGYLHESSFSVDFDSKENFDENFNSSWFNYYR
jgi:hypothetical protein